jgi:hypothetical protein
MRIYFVRHGETEANLLHEVSNRGLYSTHGSSICRLRYTFHSRLYGQS